MLSGLCVLKRCSVSVAASSSPRSRSLHQSTTVTSRSAESATHVFHPVQPTAANAAVVTLHSSVRAYTFPFPDRSPTHASRQQQEEVEVVHSPSRRRCICVEIWSTYERPKHANACHLISRQCLAMYFVSHLTRIYNSWSFLSASAYWESRPSTIRGPDIHFGSEPARPREEGAAAFRLDMRLPSPSIDLFQLPSPRWPPT